MEELLVKFSKFFIPYIILLILLGFRGQIVISFCLVFIHESVHYLTARCMGFSGFDVEILPVGAVLKVKDLDEATPMQDFIIALSGPLSNIVMAAIFYVLFMLYPIHIFVLIILSNLAIGLFNLIPALPLDGGRILRDIIANKTIFKIADGKVINYSIIIGCAMMFSSLYLFFQGRLNMNLGLIALFIVSYSLKEKERIVYIIMGDIIKKNYKFLKRGFIENKLTSVFYKKDLIYTLSLVDKGRYNIFTVLDDNMNVVDIIYEGELIEALKRHGNMLLEEYIKIREDTP